MDKQEKKKLMQEFKVKQEQDLLASLPMQQDFFQQLFDFLNEQLETTDCQDDLTLTRIFLQKHDLPEENIIS